MKSSAVLLLILAGLSVSVLLQAAKNTEQDDIDRMAASLSPVQHLIPSDASIAFRGEPGKTELLFWARLIMAPRFLDGVHQHDTTLIIRNINDPFTIPGQRMIWEYTDSQYHYVLTTNR
jgi:hypothetical protein